MAACRTRRSVVVEESEKTRRLVVLGSSPAPSVHFGLHRRRAAAGWESLLRPAQRFATARASYDQLPDWQWSLRGVPPTSIAQFSIACVDDSVSGIVHRRRRLPEWKQDHGRKTASGGASASP